MNRIFDRLYNSLPKRHRGFVQEHIPGGGANGFAWADSLTSQLVHDGDISVLLMGTLANNPTELEDAEYILAEYRDAARMSSVKPASLMAMLSTNLEGPFAYIIHDRGIGRVLAARDAEGEQPLFWGTSLTPDGTLLLFGTDLLLLKDDCKDAAEFPSGAVFVSKPGSIEGTVCTFGASTLLQPELCRVESANNIVGFAEVIKTDA